MLWESLGGASNDMGDRVDSTNRTPTPQRGENARVTPRRTLLGRAHTSALSSVVSGYEVTCRGETSAFITETMESYGQIF